MKATGVGQFLAVAVAIGLLTVSIATAAKNDQREVRMQAGHKEQLAEDQLKEAIQLYKRAVHKESSSERLASFDSSAPLTPYGNDAEFHVRTDGLPDGKSVLAVLARKDGTNRFVLIFVADGSVRVLKTLQATDPQNVSRLTVLEGMRDWIWCMLHFCKRWG